LFIGQDLADIELTGYRADLMADWHFS